MLRDIQDEILKLKKEKDFCILAHCYQSYDILEIADYVGDSFGLSKEAAKTENKNILMCGVRFMAETVKILSPQKNVYVSDKNAGCPMAEQLTVESLRKLKEQYKGYTVVAYINTTAALKTECDVCVTSASALEIVRKIDNDKILFIPDINLGSYIKENVPEKEIVLFDGGCPVHGQITGEEAEKIKEQYPNAKLLVHPECKADVLRHADYVGSTTGIMKYAKESERKEFIIGTENSIVENLQYECSDKMFYPLSKRCVCNDMKLTTLNSVLGCLMGTAGYEIKMDEDTRLKAKHCIDEMLRLG